MRFSETVIIGERLNSTNSKVRRILEERNAEDLLAVAGAQVGAGASWLDINAAMLMGKEQETLLWAGAILLEKFEAGVCMDSPDMQVLERCAGEFGRRCIVNSLTADPAVLEKSIPAVAGAGAGAIIMLKTSEGIPGSPDERLDLASGAAGIAERYGMPPEQVFFDPVFQPVATVSGGLGTALDTLRALSSEFPRHNRVGGLSNVSFGLPKRKAINRTFLAMAISCGLSAVICDPTDRSLIETLKAAEALAGADPGCMRFLKYYREGIKP